MVGAVVSVVLPELLSCLAEYRLLFFGALLLVVLWLAPDGVLGTLARLWRRVDPRTAVSDGFDVARLPRRRQRAARRSSCATSASPSAASRRRPASASPRSPGKVTSVIGPNGAGKTTVLNMIGGFYRPDTGSIRLGDRELAGAPAWKVARAGIARTYQTTKLFGTLSVLDNVLIALRRGRLGEPCRRTRHRARIATPPRRCSPSSAITDRSSTPAGDLPHVDRRLVEIARALATRPRVLLLDEPAAGLMRADKDSLEPAAAPASPISASPSSWSSTT